MVNASSKSLLVLSQVESENVPAQLHGGSQQESRAPAEWSAALRPGTVTRTRALRLPPHPGPRRGEDASASHLFWPIRWALAAACKSFCGLKSLSTKITVSAAVRFMPTPPVNHTQDSVIGHT